MELLSAKPPHPMQKGLQGRGALVWAPSCPDHPVSCSAMEGHSPPLTPAPLCLSGQDYGFSRPPPHFGSIYHVRGNETPQQPLPGGAEDAQHRAGPGHPSTKLGQLPTAECLSLTWHPWGQQLGQLWVCMLSGCWGAWGGMSGC